MIERYLSHAVETEKERYAWEFWQTRYPFMLRKEMPFQSFGDYMRSLAPVGQQQTKDPEEIEAEMSRVVAAYEQRKGR